MVAALTVAIALQQLNSLTPTEVKEGWKLLFDGKDLKGWHNFKKQGVGPGWVVKDGVLTIDDPGTAGDIVTDGKYEWFELQLDYNLDKGGNSGIMFHVADTGEETWHSGPEVQIYDHAAAPGVEISGYLYELYASPVDASHPAGQWNHLRIIVAPKKCETYLNDVKYYEYELGSKDFWARVAKSKFAAWPEFAKSKTGTIAIQGDHGQVSFRNIKIKVLKG